MSGPSKQPPPPGRGPRSAESQASIGIGDEALSPPTGCLSQQDLPRLLPESAELATDPVFNAICYVIYCVEHQNVGVTNVSKCKCTWLPFVVLPETSTWVRASHEGLSLLLGHPASELAAADAFRAMPVYDMSYLHILRVQVAGRMVLRLSMSVLLYQTPGYTCCQNSERINYMPLSEVNSTPNRQPAYRLWGPELPILTAGLFTPPTAILQEFTAAHTLHYLSWEGSQEQVLLQTAKLGPTEVEAIFADYLEHCYPALYMCYESLTSYLLKYKHTHDEDRLMRLFAAFCLNRRWFVDFHEFLVGLVALEPDISSCLDARIGFIFRYYTGDQLADSLTPANLENLLRDVTPTATDLQVAEEAASLLAGQTGLSLEQFRGLFGREETAQKLSGLCRSPESILRQIGSVRTASQEEERSARRRRQEETLTGRRQVIPSRPVGTCWGCRVQEHTVATHCLTINPAGCAVEPTLILPLIQAGPRPGDLARHCYSEEVVFSPTSLPNLFLDLTRNFAAKREALKLTGLLATKEDASLFVKYTTLLCTEVGALLGAEEKLLRINAPAIVIGDLQGSLTDLLQLEKSLFTSFPLIPESLVFLGNYTGPVGFSVEVLVYLFALKLLSPNKVYLLRGLNELNSRYSADLAKECSAKYGAGHGKTVHRLFLRVFARLPIALLVDESILCTHSAIPSPREPLDGLLRLPKDLANLGKDTSSSVAYDIITRYPRWTGKRRGRNYSVQSTKTNNIEVTEECKTTAVVPGKTTTGDPTIESQLKTTSNSANQRTASGMTGSGSSSSDSEANDDSINITADSLEIIKRPPSQADSELREYSFKAPGHTLSQGNLHFLKTRKVGRKEVKFKRAPEKTTKSEKHRRTFDKKEFLRYLATNDLSYLIRSRSICANGGFKLNFNRQCLSIYSCSQTNGKTDGHGAVALIDGLEGSIRCLRYNTTLR